MLVIDWCRTSRLCSLQALAFQTLDRRHRFAKVSAVRVVVVVVIITLALRWRPELCDEAEQQS